MGFPSQAAQSSASSCLPRFRARKPKAGGSAAAIIPAAVTRQESAPGNAAVSATSGGAATASMGAQCALRLYASNQARPGIPPAACD